jgi:peptidoglycan hydrolase CwlO-like protein
MARPSKLTEKQWAEVERRHLKGEKISALAKEYGVGVQTIRDRVSVKNAEIKEIAKQIVETEKRFSALPVSVQVSVRTLADELKSISTDLASAAALGANTAKKLAAVANAQAHKIDESKPLDEKDVESLKAVVAMTNAANGAANIGLNLMSANKGREPDAPKRLDELSDDELYAIATGGSGRVAEKA